MEKVKARVIFRKFKDDGDIIALIFDGNSTNYGTVESYMRIGQHSEVDSNLTGITTLATPEEYQDLKEELESIGYILDIRKRVNKTWFNWV